MTDIVERLRNASHANAPSRCMEAAAEIERLREDLEYARARIDKLERDLRLRQ